MNELIEEKIRKAIKPHVCDYCGETIEKGEEYEFQKNIYDGHFYEWHTHLSCGRIASAIWDYVDPDEGMTEEEFQDGCQEICQRFVCPDCPSFNKEYADCDKDEFFCINKMDEFFKTHVLYFAGRQGYAQVWKCKERKDEGTGI